MTANIAQRSLLGNLQKAIRFQKNAGQLSTGGYHLQRQFSVGQPLCTTYTSPLPDSYYNEEQKQMQETCAKVLLPLLQEMC